MKTIITLLYFIALTFSVYAQTEKNNIADIDKKIINIKNKTFSFQKIVKSNTHEGYRFVYFKGKELQLITVRQIEKYLEKNIDWFYVNDALVYTETIWLDSNTKKVIKNEKQYLDNGHLIVWFNPEGKLVDNNSIEFKNMDTELTAYGIKIKNEALK